ncbi:MAG TPA: hypothetical protein VJ256_04960 [Dehalococcoidia bacterium]|nr:hypothetical protein [Dehalococcoidia bacterium]
MEIKLKLLADYANTTPEGKLNIMGVFDIINPPMLPYHHPQMYLVISYDASSTEAGQDKNARVVLLDADGRQMLALEQQIRVSQPERPGMRVQLNQIVGLAGVRFAKAGDYQFSILVSGEEKGTVPFHVNGPPGPTGVDVP